MNEMWDRVTEVAARIDPDDAYEAEVSLLYARRAARSAVKDLMKECGCPKGHWCCCRKNP